MTRPIADLARMVLDGSARNDDARELALAYLERCDDEARATVERCAAMAEYWADQHETEGESTATPPLVLRCLAARMREVLP